MKFSEYHIYWRISRKIYDKILPEKLDCVIPNRLIPGSQNEEIFLAAIICYFLSDIPHGSRYRHNELGDDDCLRRRRYDI